MKNITVEKLKQILDEKQDINLIDVRTMQENEEFNIGGTNIPLDKLEENLDKIDKNKKTIVYCRSGHRSALACEILEKNNFENVYNLLGGMLEWQENN